MNKSLLPDLPPPLDRPSHDYVKEAEDARRRKADRQGWMFAIGTSIAMYGLAALAVIATKYDIPELIRLEKAILETDERVKKNVEPNAPENFQNSIHKALYAYEKNGTPVPFTNLFFQMDHISGGFAYVDTKEAEDRYVAMRDRMRGYVRGYDERDPNSWERIMQVLLKIAVLGTGEDAMNPWLTPTLSGDFKGNSEAYFKLKLMLLQDVLPYTASKAKLLFYRDSMRMVVPIGGRALALEPDLPVVEREELAQVQLADTSYFLYQYVQRKIPDNEEKHVPYKGPAEKPKEKLGLASLTKDFTPPPDARPAHIPEGYHKKITIRIVGLDGQDLHHEQVQEPKKLMPADVEKLISDDTITIPKEYDEITLEAALKIREINPKNIIIENWTKASVGSLQAIAEGEKLEWLKVAGDLDAAEIAATARFKGDILDLIPNAPFGHFERQQYYGAKVGCITISTPITHDDMTTLERNKSLRSVEMRFNNSDGVRSDVVRIEELNEDTLKRINAAGFQIDNTTFIIEETANGEEALKLLRKFKNISQFAFKKMSPEMMKKALDYVMQRFPDATMEIDFEMNAEHAKILNQYKIKVIFVGNASSNFSYLDDAASEFPGDYITISHKLERAPNFLLKGGIGAKWVHIKDPSDELMQELAESSPVLNEKVFFTVDSFDRGRAIFKGLLATKSPRMPVIINIEEDFTITTPEDMALVKTLAQYEGKYFPFTVKHLDEALVDILTHAKQGKIRLDEKLTDNEITKNIVRKFLKTGKEVEITNQSARDKWKQLEDEIRNEE